MRFFSSGNGLVGVLFSAAVFGFQWSGPAHAAEESPVPSASELLKAADRARGAAASLSGMSWKADIESMEGDQKSHVVYKIKVKGNDALAEAIEPARNKGETYLFNDRNLWYFKPGLKKPVSISPRQKLMGQAANGDIASTNYFKDYEAIIVNQKSGPNAPSSGRDALSPGSDTPAPLNDVVSTGSENIDGKPCWKLDLKAKGKNVTYDKIHYWISKSEQLGVKAEFLTVGGDIFKIATFQYKNKVTIKGKTFPFVSTMQISDAKNDKNVTTFHYSSPKEEAHSPTIFNVNNFIR